MATDRSIDGPGRYFADHPAIYGLSLAGSAGTAAYAAVHAVHDTGVRRVRWVALALLQMGIAGGIVITRHGAMRG